MRKIFFAVLCILLIFSAGVAAADDTWIKIDPISKIAIGDTLIFSGTTNAVPGTQLDVGVHSATLLATSDYPIVFSGKATVIKGTAGINFWSAANDTAKMLADEYEVRVSDAAFGISVIAHFNLCKEQVSLSPSKKYRATINPVASPASGESYVFLWQHHLTGRNGRNRGCRADLPQPSTVDSDHVFSLPSCMKPPTL